MDGKGVTFYETHWTETVGYMEWHLLALRERGVEINSLIDIGAAHGDFSLMFKDLFGDVDVTAIEANPLDKHYLDRTNWNVIYKALGKENGKQVFYTNPDDPVGGGSSLYRENTAWFDNAKETEMDVVTLDSLNLKGDFVKIDVQGAELDILQGGKETLKDTKFLLLELSFLDYNVGAPLIDEVLRETYDQGFRMLDTFGPVKGGHIFNDKKNQVDVLLAKKDLPVFVV